MEGGGRVYEGKVFNFLSQIEPDSIKIHQRAARTPNPPLSIGIRGYSIHTQGFPHILDTIKPFAARRAVNRHRQPRARHLVSCTTGFEFKTNLCNELIIVMLLNANVCN